MTSSNLETADGTAPTDIGGTAIEAGPAAPAPVDAPRKPRAARRIPKSDAVLEAAVDRARAGILEVAPEAQVGRHVSATVEGERLVTHRFEAFVPGYGGWQWYASVARIARSKDVTVCEVGLLPSTASLLAPEWLPWSERVRPEDSQPDGVPTPQGGADPSTDVAGSAPADDGPSEGLMAAGPASGSAGDTRADDTTVDDTTADDTSVDDTTVDATRADDAADQPDPA